MNQLLNLLLQSQGFKVLVALIILAIGFGIAKLLPRIRRWILEKTVKEEVEKIKEARERNSWLPESIVIIIAILISLALLNASLTENLLNNVLTYAPSVLTTILIVILGFVVANVITDFVRRFLKTFRSETTEGTGISPKFFDMTVTGIKIFLYIIIVEIAATQIGFSWQLLSNTLTAASYAVVFLLALVAFFGFKDLIENYAAGIYLRGSKMLKPGKEVRIGDERGEIRNVSNFSTTISTESGYFMQIPNSVLREKEIFFKRSKAEVETLEDVKKYFSARKPSLCGVASVETALAMFGYDVPQDEIEEVVVGEEEVEKLELSYDDYGEVIENLTSEDVKTAWVPFDKIRNLRDELKAWFNDGALVMMKFEKTVIFPESETSNFVLCVGVEGDEILILDPDPETGGVYYADYKDLTEAMKEWENSRGYIALAPEGSTAYWRVKKGLIYSHPNLYDELSKSLEVQLSKILRKSRILKDVMPEAVSDFVEKWRSEEKAEKVWEPEE